MIICLSRYAFSRPQSHRKASLGNDTKTTCGNKAVDRTKRRTNCGFPKINLFSLYNIRYNTGHKSYNSSHCSSDDKIPKVPFVICAHNRVVPAVQVHVVPQHALAGGNIDIGVDKPSNLRVIVAGLEVVQPRLGIVNIPTVAERVLRA